MAQPVKTRRSPWRIDRKGVIAIVIASVLVLAAGGSYLWNTVLSEFPLFGGGGTGTGGVGAEPGAAVSDNPLASGRFYVDPDSSAVRAAADPAQNQADAAAFLELAAVPQAIWLVPEEHPTLTIGAYVSGVVSAAKASDTIPVFVVYGIPERDCGNQSAGGLTAEQYPLWIDEIAAGLGTDTSVVVLEPDSLALADECGNADSRVATTQDAITRFDGTGALVYLDGGHSNWHPATQTAALLERAGVDRVRGFVTNVSNYNTTSKEVAYAEQVSSITGGAHYIVDTSRNGNGSDGEWCNPSGRALGDTPRATNDGHHDADMWIKTPGESDGTCNGGPPAGDWWSAGALALIRN